VAAVDPTQGIDKVREILFGAQLRDTEARLTRLEESLRSQLRSEISSIERKLETELDALRQQIDTHARERNVGDGELGKRLDDVGKTLAEQLEALGTKLERSQDALRSESVERGKKLEGDVARLEKQLADAFERGFADLDGRKADRGALSALLAELAAQLRDSEPATDPPPPAHRAAGGS
jgi:hypothetical protein